MGADSNSNSSPNGKRVRDPEDEVYIDNLHSHKRYLSEIMASSLNGLTVGDTLGDNILDSPARDDMPWQYSPMSEDSDECRYGEIMSSNGVTQPESVLTSPISPCRYQKHLSAFAPGSSSLFAPWHGGSLTSSPHCPHPRQRGSDSDGRFPSSPSDICHSADLRRAALLRSVQIRSQCVETPNMEVSYGIGSEPAEANVEDEDRQFPTIMKEQMVNEYSTSKEKSSCRALDMDIKDIAL